MYKYITYIFVSLLLVSCKSSEEFSGFSYDPPNSTDTSGREIELQPRRTIGVDSPKVWVSNEFEGARVNDFYAVGDSVFEVLIEPENAPVNNSPWYAFKIWSDTLRMATIRLNYNDGSHRYLPKVNSWVKADQSWKQQMQLPVRYDTATGMAEFEIMLAPDPIIISGQPMHTSSHLMQELESREIITHPFVEVKEAGQSKLGRPIWELQITEIAPGKKAPVLGLIARQHPPEITGYMAALLFLEELTADHELAREFRNTFVIRAIPMVNPDGVDLGHWRHNAAGIDLNRDWESFNQPETQTVRDTWLPIKTNALRTMFYAIDFHSTNENIFYPIDEEVKTTPDNVTQRWAEQVIADNPEANIRVEEFDTSSPIAKNWIYHTFGSDAVTYEVNDRIEPAMLDSVSRSAARSLMQLLLDEWHKTALEN